MFHDSSAAALTYNYAPSCSVTHHQVNSTRTNPTEQSDTIFQPQLLPNFSTAPFSSAIQPVDTSAPISAVPPQASSFSCLSDQHTNLSSVVTYAQYLPPASTQPFTSMAYRSNTKNEIGSHHNFPNLDKHSQSQQLNDHYQMNGNYPGGMGSLQQEFARMVIS